MKLLSKDYSQRLLQFFVFVFLQYIPLDNNLFTGSFDFLIYIAHGLPCFTIFSSIFQAILKNSSRPYVFFRNKRHILFKLYLLNSLENGRFQFFLSKITHMHLLICFNRKKWFLKCIEFLLSSFFSKFRVSVWCYFVCCFGTTSLIFPFFSIVWFKLIDKL